MQKLSAKTRCEIQATNLRQWNSPCPTNEEPEWQIPKTIQVEQGIAEVCDKLLLLGRIETPKMRQGQEIQTGQVRSQVETIYQESKVECPSDLKEMKEFF